MKKSFNNNIIQKIGVPATENDFDKEYLTPTFEYYNDDHQDAAPDAPPENLTPTPEIGDNYLNMELMLPRGGTLARGRVTERKCDQEGNVIGRSNANPILKLYFVFSSVKDGICIGSSNDIAFVVTFALFHSSPCKGATARQH